MEKSSDIWDEWLRHRRFGDPVHQAYAMEQYKKLASRIVEKAEIFESATVLDIGAGDGLVGITALQKLGARGKLILSDISEVALSIPKEIFNQKKTQDPRVKFLVAGAENLSSLQDSSIDRVVIRSVILYVGNKEAAFKEIFRILKQGGAAVIWEPINNRHIEFRKELFHGYRIDCEPLSKVQSLLKKVNDETNRQINTTQSSLVGYDEHTLVHMAIGAGFEEIKLEYTLIRSSQVHKSWEFFFDSAPNPHAQTLHELMTSVLSADEFNKAVEALKEVFQRPAIRTTCEALYILKK
jgi:ubiquinone/menaquinone biosynthesis C-methylase UbiE